MSNVDFVVGTVKWFDPAKGYGFAVVDGKDIFLHRKRLRGLGCSDIQLDEGEKLRFKIENGPRGVFANEITKA